MTVQSSEESSAEVVMVQPTPATVAEVPVEQLSEKQKEIQRLKRAEVFMVKETGAFECRVCSFQYNEAKEGTGFKDLPNSWRCPQCLSQKGMFTPKTSTIAGFAENQEYGFGTNAMTGDSKNLLIFGGLALFFVLFLGGYLLD
jgi:rubredoxin